MLTVTLAYHSIATITFNIFIFFKNSWIEINTNYGSLEFFLGIHFSVCFKLMSTGPCNYRGYLYDHRSIILRYWGLSSCSVTTHGSNSAMTSRALSWSDHTLSPEPIVRWRWLWGAGLRCWPRLCREFVRWMTFLIISHQLHLNNHSHRWA